MMGRWIDAMLFNLPERWLRYDALRIFFGWVVRWRAEWRMCPSCSDNPLQILAPRRRFFGRCPKCDHIWG